jgi:phosphoribosylanthranilate isomerase
MDDTKLKICGLQTINDVHAVNAIRPDYIGFVFAKSSRRISEETAAELRSKLVPGIIPVGVFVNEDIEKIIRLCRSQTIDVIQLHGDEDEEYLKQLKDVLPNPVIRAVRVRSMQDIRQAEEMRCDYLLLDAYKEKEYGGSGVKFDWELIPRMKMPFFLAGGINSTNVVRAIQEYRPYCIDVSTGVETEGRKDPAKLKELSELIRES